MTTNFVFYSSKVLLEVAKDLIYFPLWWYTRGVFKLLLNIKNFLVDMWQTLAVAVWLRNLFVPMYGQRDFAGFMISFFVRLLQIILRTIFFLVLIIVCLAVVVAWLLLPLFLIYQIIWQLSS